MIQLTGVVKEFQPRLAYRRPPVRALDGIDLAVGRGTALGIVGLNGAGKSTLLRLLMGYARPTAGELAIERVEPRHYVSRHGVAYVPERVSVQRSWTVRHALRAFAMLGGIADDPWARVESSIERLGLAGLADRRVAALSKGNLQRLAIAQAILPHRKLMVLDEPTEGLDPVWIVELRAIVAEWRAADSERVVILASHALPEVERLTDRVLLLHNGRFEGELKAPGEAASLEDRFLSRIAELPEARA